MTTIDTTVSSNDGWTTISIDDNSNMVVYNPSDVEVLFKIDSNSTSKGIPLTKDNPITVDTDIEILVPSGFNNSEVIATITKIVS